MSNLHINRPRFSEYIARWRPRGARKFTVISTHRTEKAAMRAAFKFAIDQCGDRRWFRIEVAAYQEWYGLTILAEVRL